MNIAHVVSNIKKDLHTADDPEYVPGPDRTNRILLHKVIIRFIDTHEYRENGVICVSGAYAYNEEVSEEEVIQLRTV